MRRLGFVVLVSFAVACGGRAEHTTFESGGSAGANAGGGDMALGGQGGASGGGGRGGPAGGGGRGGAAAGQGGTMSGGAAGGNSVEWACDEGTVTEHFAGTDELVDGFDGTIDGTPVRLSPVDPAAPVSSTPGTIRARVTRCKSKSYEIDLYLDAPYENQRLIIYTMTDSTCHVRGSYYLNPDDDLGGFGAQIALALDAWDYSYSGTSSIFVLKGHFSAEVSSPDGIHVHSIEGDFVVAASSQVCID